MTEKRKTAAGEGGGGFQFLDWLPWEKITMWAVFLLLVFSLRSFFFIVFMTFIIAYSMKGLVDWLAKLISPDEEKAWLYRLLTIVSFLALIGGGYGVGRFFAPRLVDQVELLIPRAEELASNPGGKLNEVLRDTLGQYLLNEKYGSSGDDAYDKAYKEYKARGLRYREFDAFKKETGRLEKLFEINLVEKQAAEAQKQDLKAGSQDERLLVWILAESYDEVFNTKAREFDDSNAAAARDEGVERNNYPFFAKLPEAAQRKSVRKYVKEKIESDADFKKSQQQKRSARLKIQGLEYVNNLRKKEPAVYREKFAAFYAKLKTKSADGEDDGPAERLVTYPYDKYRKLSEALALEDPLQSFSAAYDAAVSGKKPDPPSEADQKAGFELKARTDALAEWKQGGIAKKIGAKLEDMAGEGLADIGAGMKDLFKQMIYLPIALGLSLLLSFFVVFDLTKMRRGVRRLQSSRLKDFYLEIAPGLISFGRLIGRAFQAQAVIALFNTILTFLLIGILGIDNQLFLCSIVFICSFIPVLGVVLSSVP
ncbi:MAG: AI-2E family transporter, partial [Planctomycetota bacterium]